MMTGLSPATFYRMSLREFGLCQRGFILTEKLKMQRDWEIGRFISFYSAAPHAKKGSLRKMQDIVKFEWENIKSDLPTEEEKQAILKKYNG